MNTLKEKLQLTLDIKNSLTNVLPVQDYSISHSSDSATNGTKALNTYVARKPINGRLSNTFRPEDTGGGLPPYSISFKNYADYFKLCAVYSSYSGYQDKYVDDNTKEPSAIEIMAYDNSKEEEINTNIIHLSKQVLIPIKPEATLMTYKIDRKQDNYFRVYPRLYSSDTFRDPDYLSAFEFSAYSSNDYTQTFNSSEVATRATNDQSTVDKNSYTIDSSSIDKKECTYLLQVVNYSTNPIIPRVVNTVGHRVVFYIDRFNNGTREMLHEMNFVGDTFTIEASTGYGTESDPETGTLYLMVYKLGE